MRARINYWYILEIIIFAAVFRIIYYVFPHSKKYIPGVLAVVLFAMQFFLLSKILGKGLGWRRLLKMIGQVLLVIIAGLLITAAFVLFVLKR